MTQETLVKMMRIITTTKDPEVLESIQNQAFMDLANYNELRFKGDRGSEKICKQADLLVRASTARLKTLIRLNKGGNRRQSKGGSDDDSTSGEVSSGSGDKA